jgi:hypothetical protein
MLTLYLMSERAENILRKIAEFSLFTAAGATFALFLVRIYYAISFTTPYMLSTTGYEWESMLSIWNFIHHQAIYTDPHRIPFTVSYYNWGYYWFYGSITQACLHLLHLDDIWIPTIGRLISLAFTLIAGAIFWLASRDFIKEGSFARGPVAGAWCLIAACSPLVGFWAISVRPDIGALALEAAGLYVILRYLQKQNERLIILAALLFYAAWAFKQSSVTMLTGSVLALLLIKRWRAFFTLGGIWWLLVVVTLYVGGPVYRENTLFAQLHLPMTVLLGLENTLRAAGKNPLLFLSAAAVLLVFARHFHLLASRPIEAGLTLVVISSCCFAFITSCKSGANDNYYIPAAWAAMLAFALMSERINVSIRLLGLVPCSLLLVLAVALIPTGLTYFYNYRDHDVTHHNLAVRLSRLPGPALVTEPYSNLPWMQRFSPHFVIPDTYYFDRAAAVPLEEGGWEGLADKGYFATLVFDQDFIPSPSTLQKYKLVDEYLDRNGDFKFYRRIEPKL